MMTIIILFVILLQWRGICSAIRRSQTVTWTRHQSLRTTTITSYSMPQFLIAYDILWSQLVYSLCQSIEILWTSIDYTLAQTIQYYRLVQTLTETLHRCLRTTMITSSNMYCCTYYSLAQTIQQYRLQNGIDCMDYTLAETIDWRRLQTGIDYRLA